MGKNHVVSTYFFHIAKNRSYFDVPVRRNFDLRNIYVVSKYFFWCNIDEPKIGVIFMYLILRNFDGWKIDVISMYFFQSNFDLLFNALFWCNFDQIPVCWIENWHSSDMLNLLFILSWKSLEEAFVSINMQTYNKYLLKFPFLIVL